MSDIDISSPVAPLVEQPWLLWLIGALIALLLLQSFRLWLQRGAAGRRVRRHNALGAAGEKKARKLLKKAGYAIVDEQASGSYQLRVDGQVETIHLRGDFLVEGPMPGRSRKRGRYLAEVKAGEEAAKITGRATRRQLLEYSLAFDVDGVLLVDVPGERVRVVEFP